MANEKGLQNGWAGLLQKQMAYYGYLLSPFRIHSVYFTHVALFREPLREWFDWSAKCCNRDGFIDASLLSAIHFVVSRRFWMLHPPCWSTFALWHIEARITLSLGISTGVGWVSGSVENIDFSKFILLLCWGDVLGYGNWDEHGKGWLESMLCLARC